MHARLPRGTIRSHARHEEKLSEAVGSETKKPCYLALTLPSALLFLVSRLIRYIRPAAQCKRARGLCGRPVCFSVWAGYVFVAVRALS